MENFTRSGEEELTMEHIEAIAERPLRGSVPLGFQAKITQMYNRALIPEMELLDTPSNVLIEKVNYFESLRTLARQLESRKPEDVQQSIVLMERIGRDMNLYLHFAERDKKHAKGVTESENVRVNTIQESRYVESEALTSGPSIWASNSRQGSTVNELPSLRHATSLQSFHTIGITTESGNNENSNSISVVPPGPSGIFTWTFLRTMCLEFAKKDFGIKYGFSTVFTISSGISIGTSSSIILLYDLSQVFQGSLDLGDKSIYYIILESKVGVVSSIDICPDHTQIAAGYSEGYVALWDVKSRSLIKMLNPTTKATLAADGHSNESEIVSVIIPNRDIVFSADIKGNAFQHTFINRYLYIDVKTSRIHGRIETGPKKTETTILSMAAPGITTNRFPGDSNYLVAIASPYKLAILAMKPVPQILFRIPWSQMMEGEVQSKITTAQLSWCVPVYKHEKVQHIMLAFSFLNGIGVIKINWNQDQATSLKKRLKFTKIAQSKSESTITSLTWITSKFIIASTSDGNFEAYHSSDLSLIESVKISPKNIVSDSKWNNNTNHRRICHSIRAYRNRMFVLAENEIWFAGLLKWQERLNILVRSGNFQQAFEVGISLFEGNYAAAVLGLPENVERREAIVADYMNGLLLNLVSMTLSSFDSNASEDFADYVVMCKLVFNVALRLQQQQLIFGEIWDRFVDAGVTSVFLTTLQEFIIQERLKNIPNPEVVQLMFEKTPSQDLEHVIMLLDPLQLDLDNSLQLCRKNGLVNALVRIYNSALQDYLTPIVEILQRVETFPETRSENLYTLFVYFACIFAGSAFPFGSLADEEKSIAAKTLFSFLCSPEWVAVPSIGIYKLGGKPWPYFHYLLALDTLEMMKVLGVMFENSELDEGVKFAEGTNSLLVTRQYIINILLQLLSEDRWDQAQKDQVNSFIGRSFFTHHKHLNIPKQQLMYIFNCLTQSNLMETKQGREKGLLSLYKAGFVPSPVEDKELYLDLFRKNKFWKVLEFHVLIENRFDLAIDSYLHDSIRKIDVCESVSKWLSYPKLSEENSHYILEYMKNNASRIITNGYRLASFFNTYLPTQHKEIIDMLAFEPEKQHLYLKGLLNPSLNPKYKKSGIRSNPIHSQELYHQYLKLMGIYEPLLFRDFLEYCEVSLTVRPYQLNFALEVSNENKITRAQIWILIQMKEFKSSILILCDEMKGNLLALRNIHQDTSKEKCIDSLLQDVLHICTTKDAWEVFLDNLMFQYSFSTPYEIKLRDAVLSRAIRKISIPLILSRLLQTKSEDRLETHKSQLNYLLSSLSHHKMTVDFATTLSHTSQFQLFRQSVSELKSSFSPELGQCQICRRLFHIRAMTKEQQTENLIIFKCKHGYHKKCLEITLQKIQNQLRISGTVDDYHYWCAICGIPSRKLKKGKAAEHVVSLPDLSIGTGDTKNSFEKKVQTINKIVYSKDYLISKFNILDNLRNNLLVEDEIFMNDTFEFLF